ncbi:MAG: hypothetical protein K6B44_09020, partial [Lachnospiraceae bacterium]|nr:hypothetical protein [Lachnospiraceae bacterium]
EKLAEGSMSNEDFAAKYGLQISGKINGRTATLVQKDNFNFVVTYAEAGGQAYIQAVGIDGGLYGGSDVMSKKVISVKVVR